MEISLPYDNNSDTDRSFSFSFYNVLVTLTVAYSLQVNAASSDCALLQC